MSGSKLLDSIGVAERDRLTPYLHEQELRQGEPLLEAGEEIKDVWFPHDCVTSTVVDSADGATIEVGLMGSEGLVGLSLLLAQPVSNARVVVQIAGTATRMRADDFTEHVVQRRGELYANLLRYTDAFMAMVAQTAACNSLHDIEKRLCRWILMVHDRVGRPELELTQEYLAYMLGVRRPSVSQAASGLQGRGLIGYARGRITILDRLGLEKLSCPCYAIVRSIMEGLYVTKTR